VKAAISRIRRCPARALRGTRSDDRSIRATRSHCGRGDCRARRRGLCASEVSTCCRRARRRGGQAGTSSRSRTISVSRWAFRSGAHAQRTAPGAEIRRAHHCAGTSSVSGSTPRSRHHTRRRYEDPRQVHPCRDVSSMPLDVPRLSEFEGRRLCRDGDGTKLCRTRRSSSWAPQFCRAGHRGAVATRARVHVITRGRIWQEHVAYLVDRVEQIDNVRFTRRRRDRLGRRRSSRGGRHPDDAGIETRINTRCSSSSGPIRHRVAEWVCAA